MLSEEQLEALTKVAIEARQRDLSKKGFEELKRKMKQALTQPRTKSPFHAKNVSGENLKGFQSVTKKENSSFCMSSKRVSNADTSCARTLRSCRSERRQEKSPVRLKTPAQVSESTKNISNVNAYSRCPDCRKYLLSFPYCPKYGNPHTAYFEMLSKGHATYNEGNVEQTKKSLTSSILPSGQRNETSFKTSPLKIKMDNGYWKNFSRKKIDSGEVRDFRDTSSENNTHLSVPCKPLAAFGFVLKHKVVDRTKAVQKTNFVFQDFEDNDETRTISFLWRRIRGEFDSMSPKSGSGGEETNEDRTILFKGCSKGWKTYSIMDMVAYDEGVMVPMLTPPAVTNRELFIQRETVLCLWCAEGLEEFEARPPYFGTYIPRTKPNQTLQTDFFNLDVDAWMAENGKYEDSADEWESEPSDAETCTSICASEDDSSGAEELGDFLEKDDLDTFLSEDMDLNHDAALQIRKENDARKLQNRIMSQKKSAVTSLNALVVLLQGCDSFGAVLEVGETFQRNGNGINFIQKVALPNLKLSERSVDPSKVENKKTIALNEPSSLTVSRHTRGLSAPVPDTCRIYPFSLPSFCQKKEENANGECDFNFLYFTLVSQSRINRRQLDKVFEDHTKNKQRPQKKKVKDQKKSVGSNSKNRARKTIDEGLINFLIRHVETHAHEGFSTEIMVHEFRKKYPGQYGANETREALHLIAFRRSKDLWIVRQPFRS